MRYLIGSLVCSTLLFAQSETLIIDAQNFEADDNKVASLFKGMSHADIERVLRRAIKEMILSRREFLERSHIDVALAREYRRQS